MKTMREWAKEIHENAVAHGWWEEDRTIGEVCALIHSELSEALEEARAARPMMYVMDEYNGEYIQNPRYFGSRKPEGIAVELADAVIRMLDWMAHCGQEYRLDIVEEEGERIAAWQNRRASRILTTSSRRCWMAATAWLFGMTNRWFRSMRPKSTAKYRA